MAHVPQESAAGLLAREESCASITDAISSLTLRRRSGRLWLSGFALAVLLMLGLMFGIGWLLALGVGIWGLNIPIAWGFAITNYVWWIAIGMGGTFISAALYLARQEWRTSLSRYAEAR